MENKPALVRDFDKSLIYEYFVELERQGPGSTEATVKALSFIDILQNECNIADLGCGTGTQTMVLAQNTKGTITGIDIFPGFIKIFNDTAGKLGLQNRVKGIVGSMDNLSFKENEFDIIWSEGAIDHIGFKKGINYWKKFLKKDGYIAVTNLSWFTEERPAELEKYYLDAISKIGTIGQDILKMQKAGYIPVAAFVLSENCWTDTYFAPQEAVREKFLKKHAGDKTVEAFIADTKYEAELYSKYKQYYGYVFYIGKKL
jgi:ubiquinone/menaquinone biosynthesis C-methylase UbiE